jgi:hypothetical protein
VFTVDTYELRGRPLTIDHFFDEAVRWARSVSNRTPEASATVLMAVGRIKDNTGKRPDAVPLLSDAVALSRNVTGSHNSRLLDDGLNWLSWALAHQHSPDQAIAAARECWNLRKKTLGIKDDDTLSALADLSAMEQLKGDWKAAKSDFMDVLILGSDLDQTSENRNRVEAKLQALVLEFAVQAEHADGIRNARTHTREFLKPFIDGRRPRLRARLPFSMAQFGRYIAEQLPNEIKLPLNFKAAGIEVSAFAVELAEELLDAGHPDIDNCRQVLRSLQGP